MHDRVVNTASIGQGGSASGRPTVPEVQDLPEQLVAEEIAELFRTTTRTVHNWTRDPESPLKGYRIGRRWLYPRAEVLALLEQRAAAK
jgi:excisionase family DNA binding protein